MHPTDYKESADRSGTETLAIMTKTNGREQTLFWAHKGKLLTISATSSDPNDDMAAIISTIKGNLKWRQ
jgi:hypothetical protein